MKSYPEPMGPYSTYTIEGHFLYTAGQLPLNPVRGQLSDGFEAQCRQVFVNLQSILAEQKLDLNHIYKLNVYLTDVTNVEILNHVMTDLFEEPYPVRTAVQVSALPLQALIEVEAVARVKQL